MKFGVFKSVLLSTVACASAPVWAQDAETTAPEFDSSGAGDIVVTARRREERLQDVPVSVSAFSRDSLVRSNIATISDLTTVAPGFTFASEGGKDNVAVTLRGIGNLPIGSGTPGVVVYVNNVPIPAVGTNVPTYDVASIQVLKGPQGTLFGKNTLGGAVVIASQEPTYDFGGYIQGIYGRYDRREIEGAINVPIIADKVSLRVAGQVRRQDPRIKALDDGPGFSNVHEDNVRATLLVEPTESIRSVTILEYSKARELAGGLLLMRQNFSFAERGVFNADPPNGFGPFGGPVIGGALDDQIAAYVAAQQENPYRAYDGGIDGGYAKRTSRSIINNTSLTLGDVTLRNIFGYRKNFTAQLINTGAVGSLNLPLSSLDPSLSDLPFTLFTAQEDRRREYLSNEFQVFGDFGALNFIAGFYYNKDKSYGPSGTQFTAFSVGGVPAAPVTSHVTNETKAIFGQIGYDITDRLTLNAGIRYSWDKVDSCGGAVEPTGYVSEARCREVAATDVVDGIGTVGKKSSAPSWTVGLDYKVNPDWLLYVSSRRGYRSASVNTPLFESVFTTGGIDPACTAVPTEPGQCPDLRPFQFTGKETVTDIEVGSKWAFNAGGARGLINVAAFYSKYKNALQFLNVTGVVPQSAPDTPNNTAFGANISDQSIYGVEFEARVSPTPNFTASINGAVTKITIDKVSLPANLPTGVVFAPENINVYTPKVSTTASISWTMPFHPADGDLVFDADLFLTDDFGGQNGEELPGYILANAQLTWRNIGNAGLDIAGFVKNLTNEQYLAGSSVFLQSFPISSGYLGEPRTYGVRARLTF